MKLCAEAKQDSASKKFAVLAAVLKLNESKAVPDLATIDLFDWACEDLRDSVDVAVMFGPLRVKWAKANIENPQAVECLQSCIKQGDLASAQQVNSRQTCRCMGTRLMRGLQDCCCA